MKKTRQRPFEIYGASTALSHLFKPAASLPLLKILNVSERTEMSGVISSSEFVVANSRSQRMNTDVHSLASLRYFLGENFFFSIASTIGGTIVDTSPPKAASSLIELDRSTKNLGSGTKNSVSI